MKGSKFTEEQIVRIVKEGNAGTPVKELCRRHGFHPSTFYIWKAKFAGMEISDVKRLKALEEENRKLKRIVADQALDIVMLKDINAKKW